MKLVLQVLGLALALIFCGGVIVGFGLAYKITWIKMRFDRTINNWIKDAEELRTKVHLMNVKKRMN